MNQSLETRQVLLTPTNLLSGGQVPSKVIEERFCQSEETMLRMKDKMQQVPAQMQRASAATGSSSR